MVFVEPIRQNKAKEQQKQFKPVLENIFIKSDFKIFF